MAAKFVAIIDYKHWPWPYVSPLVASQAHVLSPLPSPLPTDRSTHSYITATSKALLVTQLLQELDSAWFACTHTSLAAQLPATLATMTDASEQPVLTAAQTAAKNKSSIEITLPHSTSLCVIRRRRFESLPEFVSTLQQTLNLCPRCILLRVPDPSGHGCTDYAGVCSTGHPHRSRVAAGTPRICARDTGAKARVPARGVVVRVDGTRCKLVK